MRTSILISLLIAGLWVHDATAAAAEPPMLDQIALQQKEIRADVLAGAGRYKDMAPITKERLLSKQKRLLDMIGDKRYASELSKNQRVEAFNTLEWIEATINNDPDNRLVCAQERKIGSNRVVDVCRTERQIKKDRDRARRQLGEETMPLEI
jgi:hypothetical protein